MEFKNYKPSPQIWYPLPHLFADTHLYMHIYVRFLKKIQSTIKVREKHIFIIIQITLTKNTC